MTGAWLRWMNERRDVCTLTGDMVAVLSAASALDARGLTYKIGLIGSAGMSPSECGIHDLPGWLEPGQGIGTERTQR